MAAAVLSNLVVKARRDVLAERPESPRKAVKGGFGRGAEYPFMIGGIKAESKNEGKQHVILNRA